MRHDSREREGTVTERASALPARTELERRIRNRKQTFDEFVAFAETFARHNGEDGTLSLRHLQRLVAGSFPASRLRPATARLLERIFDSAIEELLSAPRTSGGPHLLQVAVAVVMQETQVLLVSRRDGTGDAVWQFPAGMVKPGRRSGMVAVAETLAETGIHCVERLSLGERLHPVTNVICSYHLCDYVAGQPENLDAAENSGVAWVDTSHLTRLIAPERIFGPVLDALNLTSVDSRA